MRTDRRLLENSRVIVAMHHKPARVGHCVIFPKKAHVPRIQQCEPEDMVAMGMVLPIVKRGLRFVTGYQCYVCVMRSGSRAEQTIDQLYMEVVPTLLAKPSVEIDWDPSNERKAGTERKLTGSQAAKLVHVIRQGMGMRHTTGFRNVVYQTDIIQAELVQSPSSTAHMCISPKKLSPDLEDCDPHDIAGCLREIPRISRAIEGATGQPDFWMCILNGPDAGQKVPHLSVQLVPCPLRKQTIRVTYIGEAKISDEDAKKLSEAMDAVAGEDQVGSAVHKPSNPLESAWAEPRNNPKVHPKGTSCPYLIRARAPHPQLDEWATKRDIHGSDHSWEPESSGPFAAGASQMLASDGSYSASKGPSSRTGGSQDGGVRRIGGIREDIMMQLAAFLDTSHLPP